MPTGTKLCFLNKRDTEIRVFHLILLDREATRPDGIHIENGVKFEIKNRKLLFVFHKYTYSIETFTNRYNHIYGKVGQHEGGGIFSVEREW